MIEFSVGVNLAWQIAANEAARANCEYIEKEHLMIGLCSLEKLLSSNTTLQSLDVGTLNKLHQETAIITQLFRENGIEPRLVRRHLRERIGISTYKRTERVIHRSVICRAVFHRASLFASVASNVEVRCIHLLAAILEEPGEDIASALTGLGLTIEKLVDAVNRVTIGETALPPEGHPNSSNSGPIKKTDLDLLCRYGRDLTALAREGKLAPVIGRREEMLQVVRTLGRRRKNNPVLIGEAGVGKSAIVEGLAQRIAAGKSLPGKRIVELNLAGLIAGTKYRGEFEERLTDLIHELRAHTEVIVFLDEIHTLVGAGQTTGSLDAGNILKPALARGEIACIGATTIAEYRKHIEKDTALERRFQPVRVNEPSPEETLAILQGLLQKFGEHYGITIEPEALQAAINLSIRYITDRQLPDKAVDVLDDACALVKTPTLTVRAGEDHGQLCPPALVTKETVAEVISNWRGIPVAKLTETQASRLMHLEEVLRQRVIGQERAIQLVSARIRRARVGLADECRPLGVFLFLGPTGVGKTELAKAVAEALFDSENELIRLDMSEYQEKHAVSKLIGAPPGYVGYEEEGQLTRELRSKPYCVVLLDEAEKAHPEIWDLFLQVFENGRLTDSKGCTIVARHAIFIMTSNLVLSHSEIDG